jgi:hypothetical protein
MTAIPAAVSTMDDFWKFTTVAVAVVALYITFQQFWLAKEKLKLDLFEKRFAVFAAVRLFLTKVTQIATVSMDDFWKYRVGVAEASFLSGDDVSAFIQEVDSRALQAFTIHEQMRVARSGPEQTKLANELLGDVGWLTSRLPMPRPTFEPYMKFQHWRWIPWRRGKGA